MARMPRGSIRWTSARHLALTRSCCRVISSVVHRTTPRPHDRSATSRSPAASTRCATASGLRSSAGSTSPRYLPRPSASATTPRSGQKPSTRPRKRSWASWTTTWGIQRGSSIRWKAAADHDSSHPSRRGSSRCSTPSVPRDPGQRRWNSRMARTASGLVEARSDGGVGDRQTVAQRQVPGAVGDGPRAQRSGAPPHVSPRAPRGARRGRASSMTPVTGTGCGRPPSPTDEAVDPAGSADPARGPRSRGSGRSRRPPAQQRRASSRCRSTASDGHRAESA